MFIVRRALIILLSPILVFLLFATALDFGIVNTAGQPGQVEKVINDSGIYNTVVRATLNQAKSANSDRGQVPLTDPAIQQAAEKALSPTFLKTQTNQFIDSIYRWLNGKTETPDFRLNLAPAKASFADAVGQAAETKAATLPRCTSLPADNNLDVFSVTCLPPGVTPALAGQNAKNTITDGKGFLDNPVITAADIKSGNPSQPLFDSTSAKKLPERFQLAKKTPWVLALASIVIGTALVFSYASRRAGLRHVGISFVLIGILMLVFAWTLNWAVNNKALPKIKFDNAVMQTDIRNVVQDLTTTIDKYYYWFGGIYALIGTAAITGPIIATRYRKPAEARAAVAETSAESPSPPKKKLQKVQ